MEIPEGVKFEGSDLIEDGLSDTELWAVRTGSEQHIGKQFTIL